MGKVVNNDGSANLESIIEIERSGIVYPPRDSFNNILLSSGDSERIESGSVGAALHKRVVDYQELSKAIDIEIVELLPKVDLEEEKLVPQSRVTDAEETIAELRSQIDDLGERLGTSLSMAQGNVNISGLDALEYAQKALNDSTSGLVSSINSLSSDLASSQSSKASLLAQVSSLKSQVSSLQSQLAAKNTETSGLRSQLSSANMTITNLQIQLANCSKVDTSPTGSTIDVDVIQPPTDTIEPPPPIDVIPIDTGGTTTIGGTTTSGTGTGGTSTTTTISTTQGSGGTENYDSEDYGSSDLESETRTFKELTDITRD